MRSIKVFPFFVLTLITAWSCGPAAEDRKKMHERAKVFQDSIATFIRTTMAEAENPAPAAPAPTAGPDSSGKAPVKMPSK